MSWPPHVGALRFAIGDRVECSVYDSWKPGTVVCLMYRETEWPVGQTAPYQIKLDDTESLIYAPMDRNECIRRGPQAAEKQRDATPVTNPLELMKQRNTAMHSAASVARGREFTPRPMDVFIVTYPKCGTTWMTQVCHQVRTTRYLKGLLWANGKTTAEINAAFARAGPPTSDTQKDTAWSMRFGEITEVVPWDILASDCGQDLDAAQCINSPVLGKCSLSPRLFKSHETVGNIAPGGKYVCVVRDPADVFKSFFEFLPPYMGIPSGVITPEEFCDAIFAGASHSGDVWGHFRGWWDMGVDDDCEQSSMLFKNASDGDRNVFITSFEDMKNDLPTVVRRVGAFMKTEDDSGDLSEHDVTSVCEMCDFKFMRRNSEKFDDHFVRREMWRRIQIPEHEWAGGGVGKVREGGGGGGGGGDFPESVREKIDEKWAEVMKPRGFPSYQDFRAAIEARNVRWDQK